MQKNHRKFLMLATVFMAVMLFSQSAWAMWVIEQQQTLENGMQVRTVMSFGADAIRTDMPSQQMSTIMNFKTNKVYMLQHAQKIYLEMSMDQMKQEVKKGMKDSFKSNKNDVVATKATGEHKTIAGYDCEKIIMMKNGKNIGEIWITSKLESKKIMQVYKKFFELTGAQDAGSNDAILKGLSESIDKGFPMMSKFKDDKIGESISRVTKVVKKKDDPSYFMPPKGYNLMKMPVMPGGMQ